MKNSQKLLNLYAIKKKFFLCVCMYKMNTFALFTPETWKKKKKKNDVEVIEYGGEIWINQKHLEKKLDIANIADRTQYYSSEF